MSQPYWETQAKIVIHLQELGYRYRLNDRLPIFRLWRELIKKGRQNPKLRPTINAIMGELDYLKALRVEGLEPELMSPTRYKPRG